MWIRLLGEHSRVGFGAKNGDCHALPSGKTRNDKKRALGKVDSSQTILRFAVGLCERAQGRILGVCNRRLAAAIADSSQKANAHNLRRFNEFLRGGGSSIPTQIPSASPSTRTKDKNAKAPC